MLNEYGNDAKNNIMFYTVFPFVPECTNDSGVTFKEYDPVFFTKPFWFTKPNPHIVQAVVHKIYNKDKVVIYMEYEEKNKYTWYVCSSNELWHNTGKCKIPYYDFDKECWAYNVFNNFLNTIYRELFGIEILEDDNDMYMKHYLKDLDRLGLKAINRNKD